MKETLAWYWQRISDFVNTHWLGGQTGTDHCGVATTDSLQDIPVCDIRDSTRERMSRCIHGLAETVPTCQRRGTLCIQLQVNCSREREGGGREEEEELLKSIIWWAWLCSIFLYLTIAIHRPSTNDLYKSAGWAIYDMQAEYSRMGVPNEQWCLTNINKEYEVCTSCRIVY